MMASDPPRTVTTPLAVLRLFMRGMDTVDIAEAFGIKEHQAYKLLRFALEARRMGNVADRDTIPPKHEPPVEGH